MDAATGPSTTRWTTGWAWLDIARGVRYLVFDDAAMVHGATLAVDGGISVIRG